MPVGIVARADEARVADELGPDDGGGDVALRIDALREEFDAGDAGLAERVDLRVARDVHALRDASERDDLGLGLQVEVPEGALAAAEEGPERGLTRQDGVPSEDHEVGCESRPPARGSPARRAVRPSATSRPR